MEIRQLRCVAAVARHRHFTRAAEELHVAQSAVSQQIRRLETELGAQLFVRTSRSVVPTQAGELVAVRAARVLAETDALRGDLDELQGLLRGRVSVGGMLPTGELDLPGVLAEFSRLHPEVEVRLREGTAGEMVELLHHDELDASFALLEPDEVPAELAHERIGEEELVVVVNRDHRLAARKRVRLADLDGQPFMAFRPGAGVRRAVDAALEGAGVRPQLVFESNDIAVCRAVVSRGLGAAVLPRSFAESPGPPIELRPLAPRRLTRSVLLLWRADRHRPPAAQAFIDFALQRAGVPEPARA